MARPARHIDFEGSHLGRWLRARSLTGGALARELGVPLYAVNKLLGNRAGWVHADRPVRLEFELLRVISARTGIPAETLHEEAIAAYSDGG